MASASLDTAGGPSTGALLLERLAEHGSAAHPYAASPRLLKAPTAGRDLADLIHYLCVLHGRYPGLIDHAAARVAEPDAKAWLTDVTYAFAGERAYLARLCVAAGPVPSTPGAAGTDSAVLGQRHAMETLASSERRGCALGAAMALALDWAVIRACLDAAAARFGIESPAYPAADPGEVVRLADGYAGSAPVQRALLFGAQQILVQHHGLWDLLEARQQARGTG
ncbi:MAG: hypothetical protein QOJ91_1567 [Sphingomonadales bacterium]|jgi:hypothetical protein|nr:hypothetical protein [Sphingomonadales bacterium]